MDMSEFYFNVMDWRAAGACIADKADWQQWAQVPGWLDGRAPYRPTLAFLPAMQRRRLSYAARLMFDAAWPLLDSQAPCPVVFVSHDGEINRSFDLWQSLLREQTVSPTSFALSVHNALVGQWSMMRQDMSENTALCVHHDGFEMAFVEAYCLLQEGASRVLVLAVDEPLDEHYEIKGVVRSPFAYAFACVVSAGNQCALRFESAPALSGNLNYAGALSWIRQVVLAPADTSISFEHHYPNRQWQWTWQP